MSKYYNKDIPTEIHFVYSGRQSGKTYYEFNKIKEENKKKQEAITNLIKDSADLQLRINKAIEYINDNGILDLNGYDLIEILKGEEDTPKEDKKIEKLDLEDDGNTITLFGEKENEWTILDNVDIIVCNKINEIIDKINGEENDN